jgi:hypothetical protein
MPNLERSQLREYSYPHGGVNQIIRYLINQTLLEEVEEVVAWLAAVVSGNWGGANKKFCARLLVSEPVC